MQLLVGMDLKYQVAREGGITGLCCKKFRSLCFVSFISQNPELAENFNKSLTLTQCPI